MGCIKKGAGKTSQQSPRDLLSFKFQEEGDLPACRVRTSIKMIDLSLSLKSGRINISPIFIHHSAFTQTRLPRSTKQDDQWCRQTFRPISRCLLLLSSNDSRAGTDRTKWSTWRYFPVRRHEGHEYEMRTSSLRELKILILKYQILVD